MIDPPRFRLDDDYDDADPTHTHTHLCDGIARFLQARTHLRGKRRKRGRFLLGAFLVGDEATRLDGRGLGGGAQGVWWRRQRAAEEAEERRRRGT